MYKEFKKSGEFDEDKNEYAGFEMLFRLPIFVIIDILLIAKLIIWIL